MSTAHWASQLNAKSDKYVHIRYRIYYINVKFIIKYIIGNRYLNKKKYICEILVILPM